MRYFPCAVCLQLPKRDISIFRDGQDAGRHNSLRKFKPAFTQTGSDTDATAGCRLDTHPSPRSRWTRRWWWRRSWERRRWWCRWRRCWRKWWRPGGAPPCPLHCGSATGRGRSWAANPPWGGETEKSEIFFLLFLIFLLDFSPAEASDPWFWPDTTRAGLQSAPPAPPSGRSGRSALPAPQRWSPAAPPLTRSPRRAANTQTWVSQGLTKHGWMLLFYTKISDIFIL